MQQLEDLETSLKEKVVMTMFPGVEVQNGCHVEKAVTMMMTVMIDANDQIAETRVGTTMAIEIRTEEIIATSVMTGAMIPEEIAMTLVIAETITTGTTDDRLNSF